MNKKNFQYIYGPVNSWRLGVSLGIDPISPPQKVCNYNCVYCQLGDTAAYSVDRKVFISAQAIVDEVNSLDPSLQMDYLTFSGCGEPTLAENLGAMIDGLRQCRREKIAVITNGSTMDQPGVRGDLLKADCVLSKLDAYDQESFKRVDQPAASLDFSKIIDGMKIFAREFQGKFALQMMFVEDNKDKAQNMAELAALINADEIELNTPLRPSDVNPLTEQEMLTIKDCFKDLPVTMVYEHKQKTYQAMDVAETRRRHGNYTQNEDTT